MNLVTTYRKEALQLYARLSTLTEGSSQPHERSPKSVQNGEISGSFSRGSLTLWIDPFIENEFAVSEEVEQWLKVVWTSIDEVGSTRVRGTRPA